mmetsp:Transcript_21851/g.60676  ORF Transcript_21851/g.60676 Transcript_21851/m.60676 type:complete len:235 (-) Transcript_21851:248-952(-)|eukprot:CAMPEP_0117650382 /NCGR_PEP_ID=MMETSP0804-20121206/1510_1 /TAXON_ID=1074897 /ORGANISM="Tetraselmis astigmatica, Strain CCMP880" /LENGTH=234 /DNA_ID=CAMNT_0005456251 /DNA_START=144 /DNA_END=848 /DNA_ORIENTATION=+
MVGAPGYSSGRSVLVVCPPTATLSQDVLSAVWGAFEENGILLNFATLDGRLSIQAAADLPQQLLDRLNVAVNLQEALGFRGVSYDGLLLLGFDDPFDSTAATAGTGRVDGASIRGVSRARLVALQMVKGNKHIAATSNGILALKGLEFRGQPVLAGRTIFSTNDKLQDSALESAKVQVVSRSDVRLHSSDTDVVQDKRLLTAPTCAISQLCSCLADQLLKEDGSTLIPPYLQDP